VACKGHESTDDCRFRAYQAEYLGREQQSVCRTCKYRLKPTPEQGRALESVVWHCCRTLENTALEQRKTWWDRGQGTSATYSQQQAELPDLKAACPDYAEVNAQVLQDVLLRLDRALQAFFRRGAARLAKHRVIRASREGAALPPSPTRRWASMAARGATMASWACPRSAGLPCAGLARF
jgi:hypothetical protein